MSDAVGNLSCSGVSWDSIRLFWELPENPNGQILFYEILVKVDPQFYTYKAHSTEYTVNGLSPVQEYAITVAAVNSAGAGDRVNCTASTLSESGIQSYCTAYNFVHPGTVDDLIEVTPGDFNNSLVTMDINYILSLLTVPASPRFLTISQVTPSNVTLQWAPPLSIPGLLKEYHIVAQLLSVDCETNSLPTAQPASEDELTSDCVDSDFKVVVTALDSGKDNHSITLQSLVKYRYYRFKVAAVTNAGVGEHTDWIYARTLAGSKNTTVTMWPFCMVRGGLAVSQELRSNI